MKRTHSLSTVLASLLLIVSISCILTACGSSAAEIDAAPRNLTALDTYIVEVDTVSGSQMSEPIEVAGLVTTDEESRPGFKIGGVIATVLIEENDDVRKGQVLARLNLTEITAQVAQADLAVDKARRDLDRVHNLYQDSVATLEQYQNAQTGLDMAERQRDIATFNKQYSEVRAPISGRVIRKLVTAGEVIGPGQPICIIQGTQTKDWQIEAALTDDDWASVRAGDAAEVILDAYPAAPLKATVKKVGTMANASGGTFPVTLQLAANQLRLAAGLVGRVSIRPAALESRRLTIPLTAVVEAAGQNGLVFLPGADHTAQSRTVTLGSIVGDRVEVTAGLSFGDLVITTGSAWLREGDPITITSN